MVKKIFLKFYLFFTGFLMGISDTLPGISGSTITYVLGVYADFMKALNDFIFSRHKMESFLFLIKIGLGWLSGAIISVLILTTVADNNIYLITSIFLGVIIGTVYVTVREIKSNNYHSFTGFIYGMLAFCLTIAVFFFGWGIVNAISGIYIYFYIFLIAALAAACMLLPGISGSTILLIFGIYYTTFEAIGSFLRGDFSVLNFLVIFGFGVIFGFVISAKLIYKLFSKYEGYALNIVLGMVIGSFIPVVYGPLTMQEGYHTPLNFSNVSVLGIVFGIVVIVGLNKLKDLKDKNNESKVEK